MKPKPVNIYKFYLCPTLLRSSVLAIEKYP